MADEPPRVRARVTSRNGCVAALAVVLIAALARVGWDTAGLVLGWLAGAP